MPTKRKASVPNTRGVRTAAQIREEFDRAGITVSGWARVHNLNRWTVFEVLHGRNKGKWGEAHRAAVLLGMKDGVISTDDSSTRLPKAVDA